MSDVTYISADQTDVSAITSDVPRIAEHQTISFDIYEVTGDDAHSKTMRNQLNLLLYSLSLFIFLSCSTSPSLDPLAQPDKYFVKAKVDGVDVFYDESNAGLFLQYSYGIVQIQVRPKNNKLVFLVFSAWSSNKNLVETLDINGAGYQTDQSTVIDWSSGGNGKLSVSKIDWERAEGTFNFDVFENYGKGPKRISITEGSFRVKR